jgi:hypothetical protein
VVRDVTEKDADGKPANSRAKAVRWERGFFGFGAPVEKPVYKATGILGKLEALAPEEARGGAGGPGGSSTSS